MQIPNLKFSVFLPGYVKLSILPYHLTPHALHRQKYSDISKHANKCVHQTCMCRVLFIKGVSGRSVILNWKQPCYMELTKWTLNRLAATQVSNQCISMLLGFLKSTADDDLHQRKADGSTNLKSYPRRPYKLSDHAK